MTIFSAIQYFVVASVIWSMPPELVRLRYLNAGTEEPDRFSGASAPPSRCCLQGWPHAFPGLRYLNNHNWVEYWDNIQNTWRCPQANPPQRLICIYHPETFVAFTKLRRFLDVATSSSSEDTWFCQPGAVRYCQRQFPAAPPFLKIKQAAASQHTFKHDQGA